MGFRKKEVETADRIVVTGLPDFERCDNSISTSKYTMLTFLPVAIREQFRRIANLYFLIIGGIMAVGYYTDAFDSAISPWTTWGPLALVLTISLLQEGYADVQRHKSDRETNDYRCVVLRRAIDMEGEEGMRDETVLAGTDVDVGLKQQYFEKSNHAKPPKGQNATTIPVAFESVMRRNIRSGHLVLVRNRDMIPADLILLASSSDNGNAYVETSSIDGETNLKLRTSPHLPSAVLKKARQDSVSSPSNDGGDNNTNSAMMSNSNNNKHVRVESLEQATKRIVRFSHLAYPNGVPAVENPANPVEALDSDSDDDEQPTSRMSVKDIFKNIEEKIERRRSAREFGPEDEGGPKHYVGTLTSEPPNASVNTYSGKLTLPPVRPEGPSIDIPLNAENVLLRGALLRNTEWVIGLAVFTGTDTKLVQNSFETPSKFSKLDKLMNLTVKLILIVMIVCIGCLAGFATAANNNTVIDLWYLGFNTDTSEPWPYLPVETFGNTPPKWDDTTPNYAQLFFLYVTLLSNFIPLSLYVTVELVTFCMIFLVNLDQDMYHEKTDTRAVARSTNVTDLGQVQYIFSDKTGTLTQNVMRFKRCSVDGMIFGAPVEKFKPHGTQEEEEEEQTPFHPLRQLLVGRIDADESTQRRKPSDGLEGLGESGQIGKDDMPSLSSGDKLTFNAEMFLRVMALCHTVVVEKEFTENIEEGEKSVTSQSSGWSGAITKTVGNIFHRKRTVSELSTPGGTPLEKVAEDYHVEIDDENGNNGSEHAVNTSSDVKNEDTLYGHIEEDGPDGAPAGFQYQAESPDEGALVSSASRNFGFQVVGRDSSGVKLAVASPSLFEDESITKGLKDGSISPNGLAARTAELQPAEEGVYDSSHNVLPTREPGEARLETWNVLAVNKFDSDRKRMSIVVRSPPELGSIPMLLCKGADSSMLDPEICPEASTILMTGDETPADRLQKALDPTSNRPSTVKEDRSFHSIDQSSDAEDDWLMSTILGIQSHLGDFAREGLRTLVLGMRILSEEECEKWLATYTAAATSIKNRDEKLVAAALEIERDLHIVGATAIEDKLQRGVPDTISTLEKAGIKLWVLTGDKRETAIEIGYSTHVLTEKMHVTEVADGPADNVKTQMAMEFIRLVKMGRLKEYQKSVIQQNQALRSWADRLFAFRLWRRQVKRAVRKICTLFCSPFLGKESKAARLEKIKEEKLEDKEDMNPTLRRKAVRELADKIIQDYLNSPEGMARRSSKRRKSDDDEDVDELSLASDDLPGVFNRASSARAMLDLQRTHGRLSGTDKRTLSLASVTSQELGSGEMSLVDEDVLSLQSFFPSEKTDETSDFDRKRRTLLERMFAVDSDVRHGRLVKHVKRARLIAIREEKESGVHHGGGESVKSEEKGLADSSRPRALVIEGAALLHLLGDPLLEEILFCVASSCNAVIACRVSPKQKALVVKLVRHNVSPEPITLAIGDGANDVGMIQEAHVGVGVSGLEGKQAVNASDFAIAQFRYLEELLLIHGRWNFFRMSTVVLFSFYKNALMAGCIIVYSSRTLFSGTPLFDEWVIATLNFVAGAPILILGIFDRCLEKDYVRKHPEVYAAGRNNELITLRTIFRWLLLTLIHICTLYFLSMPPQSGGGGMTSAFEGLMSNEDKDIPGNGEGGDLKSVGTVVFTNLIILLAYKVLYESRSLIHGRFPAWWCRNKNEGFFDRLAYTWIGVTWLSLFFYLFFLYIYSLLGRTSTNVAFSSFVDVAYHVLHTRTMTWMLIIFVPVAGIAFDVTGKFFSNTFYPTQTQIHLEIASKEMAAAKKQGRTHPDHAPSAVAANNDPEDV